MPTQPTISSEMTPIIPLSISNKLTHKTQSILFVSVEAIVLLVGMKMVLSCGTG